jgi:hypothetical protein
MTNQRRPLTGSDVAGAGALLLAVRAIFAGAGAGSGVLVGAVVALHRARFFVGIFAGIAVVAKRFRPVV